MNPTFLMHADGLDPNQLDEYDRTQKWVLEEKFDGERIQAIKHDGTIRLFGRNQGKDGEFVEYTQAVPEVIAELQNIPHKSFHLDGEMIHVHSGELTGEQSFRKLCSRMRTQNQTQTFMDGLPVKYVIFDILSLDSACMEDLSLITRKNFLDNIDGHVGGTVGISVCHYNNFAALYRSMINLGMEGIMLKHRLEPYVHKRSPNWRKVVPVYTEDVVAIGFTEGTGRRRQIPLSGSDLTLDTFGAIICKAPNGAEFKVGSGFDDKMLLYLRTAIDSGKMEFPFVVEIKLKGWNESGRPRMPRFSRLRKDKAPSECHTIKSGQQTLEEY